MIRKLFDDDCGEMYLWFVHGQLNLFNTVILSMEKTNASATDIVVILKKLKVNIEERRDNKFIPQGAKKIFIGLQQNGFNVNLIMTEFINFYNRCLSYIDH